MYLYNKCAAVKQEVLFINKNFKAIYIKAYTSHIKMPLIINYNNNNVCFGPCVP